MKKWAAALKEGPTWATALKEGLAIVGLIAKSLRKTPVEKRKEAMRDLNKAVKKAKDPANPSTEDIEKWFSERV